MELLIKKHSDLTTTELEQIQNLIINGGEVRPDTLSERLLKSSLIAFFKDNNNVVATATIKIPLDSYKAGVFSKSKPGLVIQDYLYELGYVVVDNAYQRKKLASKLCRELCRIFLSSKLFATTRVDNPFMQAILKKNYFEEIGEKYPNKDNTNFLKLYIKREIMDTYHINLSKTIFGQETIWSGTVMKLSKPVPGTKNTISTAESLGRETKILAERDILNKAESLDFTNNEIIFVSTYERIYSFDELKQKLSEIE